VLGGGRAAVGQRDRVDRAATDADGLQRARLLAVRQPGVRLGLRVDARPDAGAAAGAQLVPAAVSAHAELRLVHVGRAARRPMDGRAQSADVSVLRGADSDDVSCRARPRRRAAAERRRRRVQRALCRGRRGWSEMEVPAAAPGARTTPAAVADSAYNPVRPGHQPVLLRGFRGGRTRAVRAQHWLLPSDCRRCRRPGQQVHSRASRGLAARRRRLSLLADDAAGDVTGAEDVDPQR